MSNSCNPIAGSSVHGILQAIIVEWVAISFSRGSSQTRNWTWVSYIAGRFFTDWASREGQILIYSSLYSQVALLVKKMPANAEDSIDASLIPGSGRSPGGGHGNLLQYFCLKKRLLREESGRLQSIGSQKVRHDWSDMVCMHIFITDGYTITY